MAMVSTQQQLCYGPIYFSHRRNLVVLQGSQE